MCYITPAPISHTLCVVTHRILLIVNHKPHALSRRSLLDGLAQT